MPITFDWGDNPRDTRLKIEIFMNKGIARVHRRDGSPLDVPFAELLANEPECCSDPSYVAECLLSACREAKLIQGDEKPRFLVIRDSVA